MANLNYSMFNPETTPWPNVVGPDETEPEVVDLEHLDQCYLHTFTSGPGIEVLQDMWLAYFERPLLDLADKDPALAMAFREGQRSVVLGIRAAMRRAESGGGKEVFTEEDLKR